ncbi:putative copper homeostasis (lipo)protein LpqS [Nocardia sp. NPDC003963]
MNTSRGLRRTSVALLLMAVLLIAPIVHCTLDRVDEHTHVHSTGAVAALSVGSSQIDHLDGTSGPAGHHGDQHMILCVEKSLLPSGGATVAPLLWMTLIGVITVATVIVMVTGSAQGIRGPPRPGSPALNGQAILTNFCISRR